MYQLRKSLQQLMRILDAETKNTHDARKTLADRNLGEDQKRDDEMLPFANVNENKDEGEETNATVGQILMTKCRH
ncbi:hypothetical protein MKW92_038543 [Papaver armeniacum]|nr:hypothetical protein MKW92_038543 [Papaver armeniacum]